MKDLIAPLAFLFVALMLMSMLIPSILLYRDERREEKRNAQQANPEA